MKIAMIGQKIVPSRFGGIEMVLTTICPKMVEQGHSVTCYNRAGIQSEGEYENRIKNSSYCGVKLRTVRTIRKRGFSAVVASMIASIRAAMGRYDVIHYHAEGPCAMMWIPKLFGKKCVATVHGLDWQREKWNNGLGARYIKMGERIMVRHADEIIVLSENMKQYFKDRYNRETILIPNGTSRPVVREADLITKKFGLKKDDYICTVTRLTEEKGIHYLIEAYLRMKTSKKLVIAGASSDTEKYVQHLHQMAGDNPNIIFTGFIDGEILDEIYSNAYLYVIPSNLEGMPLSLLEALSYGNAVLGSDIPEIAEVLLEQGMTFRKGSVKDLKRKLEYLERHPERVKKLKETSADYICEKYNWDDVTEKTLDVYQRVIQGN